MQQDDRRAVLVLTGDLEVGGSELRLGTRDGQPFNSSHGIALAHGWSDELIVREPAGNAVIFAQFAQPE